MLVDGVGFAEGVPMFVVEMLHSKYMEWPKAAWELQNKQLMPDLTLAVIANGKVKLPDAVIESIGSNGADLQKTIQEFNESALISFLAPE
eukprot:g27062.t1